MRRLLTAILIIFSIITIAPKAINASGVSLYLSPNTGTFLVGNTFNVSIFLNTGGNDINAAQVELKFDPAYLQVASPTAGKSLFSIWVSSPSFSNTSGTISFSGGMPSPGINTTGGLISTITLRAVAPGKTSIKILDSSEIFLNDGNGTHVSLSASQGIYEITIPPPEGPSINSSTHPDPNKWYKNNNASFDWQAEEGMTDFSYLLDKISDSAPDNVSEGIATSATFNDLEDGIWYFHLKAKKGNLWGGISHYVIKVDKTPPADFILEINPALRIPDTTTKNPSVSFLTTDAASGLSHYEIKTVCLNPKKNVHENHLQETGFFVEGESPYLIPAGLTGEYEVVVRAYDLAGNYRDASRKIEVIDAVRIFYISMKGIGFFGLFFAWWQLILIILALIIALTLLIRWWKGRHNDLKEQAKAIEELKAKIAANEQLIKKQLS